VNTASATESANAIGNDKADLSFDFVSAAIIAIDAGQPITLLAGAMAGCVELFAKEGLRTVADLKGQRVGLRSLGATPHVLASLMTAEVGLDPARDIDWVVDPKSTPIDLFVGGKVDVFVGNPPESLDLRAQRIGKVLVKTAVDRGFAPRYDYVLQTLRENGYDKWREYDAEDTTRFYALRLRETGFIKSTPQKIIADGTDWRFLNELKRELKG